MEHNLERVIHLLTHRYDPSGSAARLFIERNAELFESDEGRDYLLRTIRRSANLSQTVRSQTMGAFSISQLEHLTGHLLPSILTAI